MASRQLTSAGEKKSWLGRLATTMSSVTCAAARALPVQQWESAGFGCRFVAAEAAAEASGEDDDGERFSHVLSLGCGLEANRESAVARGVGINRPAVFATVGGGGKTTVLFALAAEWEAAGGEGLTVLTTTTRMTIPREGRTMPLAIGRDDAFRAGALDDIRLRGRASAVVGSRRGDRERVLGVDAAWAASCGDRRAGQPGRGRGRRVARPSLQGARRARAGDPRGRRRRRRGDRGRRAGSPAGRALGPPTGDRGPGRGRRDRGRGHARTGGEGVDVAGWRSEGRARVGKVRTAGLKRGEEPGGIKGACVGGGWEGSVVGCGVGVVSCQLSPSTDQSVQSSLRRFDRLRQVAKELSDEFQLFFIFHENMRDGILVLLPRLKA